MLAKCACAGFPYYKCDFAIVIEQYNKAFMHSQKKSAHTLFFGEEQKLARMHEADRTPAVGQISLSSQGTHSSPLLHFP